ncbi:MAG: monooxygenase, partial [Pseudomonadota bacterium]|nr:monooxygenase [Pseudomonadota bacterium]
MKILMSGGGIGGLTAALCFLHHGAEVTVLEQAPELGEVGAGIQIPPNAMKVFAALGLDAALAETAFRPLAIEARMGRSGLELFHIPLAEHAVKRWGAPYLHIHRADYIAVLAAALRAQSPDALQL